MRNRHLGLLCTLITLLNVLTRCGALWCYQCGVGDDAPSCELFTKSPLWRPYEVECSDSPQHVCVKTWRQDDPSSEIRACTPAENNERLRNPTGCRISSDPHLASFCMCDSDLCNSGNHSTFSLYILVFIILSAFYRFL